MKLSVVLLALALLGGLYYVKTHPEEIAAVKAQFSYDRLMRPQFK